MPLLSLAWFSKRDDLMLIVNCADDYAFWPIAKATVFVFVFAWIVCICICIKMSFKFIFVCVPGRCFLAGRRRAHHWLPLCHCGTVPLWHCGTTRQLKSREIRNTSLLSTAEQQTVGACIVLPSVYITAGWLHHDEFPSRRSRLYNMQVVRVKMMSW